MAGFGDVFGKGSSAEQFLIWGVLMQVLTPIMAPFLTELSVLAWEAVPDMPLDPDAAAEASARKILSKGDAEDAARKSGFGDDVFSTMARNAQRPPDMSAVFEALRRKLIGVGSADPDEVSLHGALTDMGIGANWYPVLEKLATSIPSAAEVLNAWLEGQIEAGEAHTRLIEAGMDPTWIQSAYNTNGEAPTPMQALEMWNRGVIPQGGTGPDAVSYTQAFLEGPWRNKWLTAFEELRHYLPPPRTVTAMFHQGSLDHAKAAELLTKQGLTTDLVSAYLSDASHTATATDKHLAKTDALALYEQQLISKADAKAALVTLKYSAHDADLILTLADARRVSAQMNSAVSRVKALYLAGKVTRTAAVHTLTELHVPSDQAGGIVDVWALEQSKEVKSLTVAELINAWYYKLITVEECDAQIVAQGHTARDAWLLRSIKAKSKQPHEPSGDL